MGTAVVCTPDIRWFFAFLSACGIAASIVAYIESFSGAGVNIIFRWWIILLPGWIALFIPIYALEYPGSIAPSFAGELPGPTIHRRHREKQKRRSPAAEHLF